LGRLGAQPRQGCIHLPEYKPHLGRDGPPALRPCRGAKRQKGTQADMAFGTEGFAQRLACQGGGGALAQAMSILGVHRDLVLQSPQAYGRRVDEGLKSFWPETMLRCEVRFLLPFLHPAAFYCGDGGATAHGVQRTG